MGDEPSSWAADGVASSSLSDDLPSSVYQPTSAISVASRRFTESPVGDGSVGNTIALRLANGAFAGRNGDDLDASGAITAENLPAGLARRAARLGDREVIVTIVAQTTHAGQHIRDQHLDKS